MPPMMLRWNCLKKRPSLKQARMMLPDPPDEPLIEDYGEEEEESANVADENDPVVSLDNRRGNIERVASWSRSGRTSATEARSS